MNNFSQESGHRVVTGAAGLNSFLTRVHGNITLTVLVSAFSAYLTMGVLRSAVFGFFSAHPGMVWVILLLSIASSMGVSFSATRSPAGAFITLMLMATIYGVEFAIIAGVYSGASTTSAFVSSVVVFVTMASYGTITKRDLNKSGVRAMAALIALMIAYLVNMFLQSPVIAYIFSFIAVTIFTALTAWDAQKMKQIYINHDGEVLTNGLAVLGALQLYLDFVNLFTSLLQIFGMSDRN